MRRDIVTFDDWFHALLASNRGEHGLNHPMGSCCYRDLIRDKKVKDALKEAWVRLIEKSDVNLSYGIGVPQGDSWGMKAGPTHVLQDMLDRFGDEGDCILLLSEGKHTVLYECLAGEWVTVDD